MLIGKHKGLDAYRGYHDNVSFLNMYCFYWEKKELYIFGYK